VVAGVVVVMVVLSARWARLELSCLGMTTLERQAD
jgi:hypothetical protein